jgi:hypothetical protein
MDVSDNQKFDVLMAQLEERYGASHKIRERCTQFTLWITGMAIGLAWLLINECTLNLGQRIALTLFTLALFWGALFLLKGFLRGGATNRATLARIEAALGLYDAGMYLPGESILPAAYRTPKPTKSHDCCTLVVWLSVVAISLVAIIWTSPYPASDQDSSAPIKQTGGNHVGNAR